VPKKKKRAKKDRTKVHVKKMGFQPYPVQRKGKNRIRGKKAFQGKRTTRAKRNGKRLVRKKSGVEMLRLNLLH